MSSSNTESKLSVAEQHRHFINRYLVSKKISVSTLEDAYEHRVKKNESLLNFMTRSAPDLEIAFPNLQRKTLTEVFRQMKAQRETDGWGVQPMDWSVTSKRTDRMDYTLTSKSTERGDSAISDGVIGMDISVASGDKLAQLFGKMRIRGAESMSGDISMASQSTSGYLPTSRGKYTTYRGKYGGGRGLKLCKDLENDLKLQTINNITKLDMIEEGMKTLTEKF